MHSSATDVILSREIDLYRFGSRYRSGVAKHDSLQQRYDAVFDSPQSHENDTQMSTVQRRIAKSVTWYSRSHRRVTIAFLSIALAGALTLTRAVVKDAELSALNAMNAVVMFVVLAGTTYFLAQRTMQLFTKEHAHVADRLLSEIEGSPVSDQSYVLPQFQRGAMRSARSATRMMKDFDVFLFEQQVHAGTITTESLHDRYLDQLNRPDAHVHAKNLRRIERRLKRTDVARQSRFVVASLSLFGAFFIAVLASEWQVGDVPALYTAAVAAALVLFVVSVWWQLDRVTYIKPFITHYATSLAIIAGYRTDRDLRILESAQTVQLQP